MRPVKIKDANADYAKPRDWDESTMGSCGSLPVRREVEGMGGQAFLSLKSNWKPDADELARLDAGGVVELECIGIQPAVSMSVVPCAEPGSVVQPIQAIRGAVARGWCHGLNTHKEMDSDLAEAIAVEIAALFRVSICPRPANAA